MLQRVHEDLIEQRTAELGADATPTLQSKTALAALLRDMDQPAAALVAQHEAVSGLVEQLGPAHADVLRVSLLHHPPFLVIPRPVLRDWLL